MNCLETEQIFSSFQFVVIFFIGVLNQLCVNVCTIIWLKMYGAGTYAGMQMLQCVGYIQHQTHVVQSLEPVIQKPIVVQF